MLTPKEIEDKIFSKSFRGYNCLDVDSFLDDVILDYEKLLNERDGLQLEVKLLKEQLEKRKSNDTIVVDSLKTAKKSVEELSQSADRRANAIVEEAKVEAKKIEKKSIDRINDLKNREEILKKEIIATSKGYRILLEEALTNLKKYEDVEKLRNMDLKLNSELNKDKETKIIDMKKDSDETPFTFEDLKRESQKSLKDKKKSNKKTVSKPTNKLQDSQKIEKDSSKVSEAKKTEKNSEKTKIHKKETVVYDNQAVDEMLEKFTVDKKNK